MLAMMWKRILKAREDGSLEGDCAVLLRICKLFAAVLEEAYNGMSSGRMQTGLCQASYILLR
jgi:hypothetical protein